MPSSHSTTAIQGEAFAVMRKAKPKYIICLDFLDTAKNMQTNDRASIRRKNQNRKAGESYEMFVVTKIMSDHKM